ncbi:hypothetical protein DSM106972_061180 [Dulcicalothrix desertica PCC 7102]|uniref:AraC-type arabinose-binding/dimerisation domain-containing protein n=1 Tax=Dulcicalothrix desertica PCC 7102 TaxID=232991 RepID=A0A433V7G1_9CYAN|nr:hypothetical protein [Dulcicalothrix desertica]RUT02043.1 hypothetical protein DSM106972_061180 [Dulcicalothrix desertica PCC 7102]
MSRACHRTRIEDFSYEGKQRAGDVWLLPAGISGYFRWDDPGELLMFIFDPQFLRQVSLETKCLNPDKVELRPTLYKQDSTLKALARSFHHEMQHNLLGGKLYIEPLANQLAIHLL